MTHDPDQENRWKAAREAAVARWTAALDRVAARDEAGTLAIANAMDEICRESQRAAARSGGVPFSHDLPCRHCPETPGRGGCLGLVGALNHWVLNGAWGEAERVVRQRLAELQAPSTHQPPRVASRSDS